MKLIVAVTAALMAPALAAAAPPIEAYGALPEIRAVAISPNGEHVAYLRQIDGEDALVVEKLGEGIIGVARAGKASAFAVEFAGPDHVIAQAGKSVADISSRTRYEYSAAFAYSLKSNEIVQPLSRAQKVHASQTGLGRIVGLSPSGDDVFMPAFTGVVNNEGYDLYAADLNSGHGRVVGHGKPHTIGWVVDRNGEIIARVDYNNKTNQFEVFAGKDGDLRQIFEMTASRPPFWVAGTSYNESGLLIYDEHSAGGYANIRELSFDGRISAPVFARPNADIVALFSDINRKAFGVAYSGVYPAYDFYDSTLASDVAAFQALFPNDSSYLRSWTKDFSKLIFRVEGSAAAEDYYLFDRTTRSANRIAQARPDIKSKDLGEILTIEYTARDGLKIPALLTMPTSGSSDNLPLIVMPHGGPADYDGVGFHWMAQYFASRGYLVFQPNFRGSYGFGDDFRRRGEGEWGGKMQDDITDGVEALIRSGRADADRICIIGGSYGGYAALAGGGFTPGLYACVAAIAPVSDLPEMLRAERREYGADHWVYDYWRTTVGDLAAEREKLKAISPVNHAAEFRAPVLLIHGDGDTVVPFRQSQLMESALRKAGKPVELVRLRGEDHWLARSETRLETLRALDAFVSAHIGEK